MKFQNYLEKITGVEIYPLISLGIFVVFFLLVTVWVFRLSKTEIEQTKRLPLE